MSVSARFSASSVIVNNNNDDNCKMRSTTADDLRQQWISIGGRLGTPDAAAPIDSSMMTSSTLLQQQQQQEYNRHQIDISTEHLFIQLHECLALEAKYQPSLYLPQESQDGEITVGTRDGAAHVLRCLKVWYELPTDVLFAAINLVDRFLTKMKVRPKHIACISVGSLFLSAKQSGLPSMDTEDLVAISQCRCTAGDLERMSGIIANKLGIQMGTTPVTALTFVRLFYSIFENAAKVLGLSEIYKQALSLEDLEMRLEILICDANCASLRACEMALVLVCTQLDVGINNIPNLNEEIKREVVSLVDYAIQLQRLCRICDTSFFHSHATVVKTLSHYNGQNKMPYRQRLVWKLSSRTMRVLRPTDRLTSYLPTIEEHNIHNALNNNLLRLRTGSVSSEDGEDWPTSPVVPVCEKC